MTRATLFLTLAVLLLPAAANPLAAWGPLGHRLAATAALKDLPPELAAWFEGQEAMVGERAADPDFWKERDPLEGPRHFLDCEAYGGAGEVPRQEDTARAQLGAELFQKSGQVPWVILDRVGKLKEAFASGDPREAALAAAFLSHYVGDLSVPLHATANYDGKDTGQHGVHRRWETGLLKRLLQSQDWVPEVRPASLGPDPEGAPLVWLRHSASLLPKLLADDLAAEDQALQAGGEALGNGYWEAFLELQAPVIKEQQNLAAQRTAQMILLAWQGAGRPVAPAGSGPLRQLQASLQLQP